MTELTSFQLAQAVGGANSYGRCGPKGDLQWLLGNHFTPQCKAHDRLVRNALRRGASRLEAHGKALPQLPSAAWSWYRASLKRRPRPSPRDL